MGVPQPFYQNAGGDPVWWSNLEGYGEELPMIWFTGKKDINEKEIFESDIIRQRWNKEMWGEVVYSDKHAGFGYILRGNWDGREYKKGDFVQGLGNVEIIGNEFENPELLDKPDEPPLSSNKVNNNDSNAKK
jgi:uncharacterized phage protein (TIGR01671 family)